MSIIVSGKNGQLGKELQLLAPFHPEVNFSFYGKDALDIANFKLLEKLFEQQQPGFFINCAAYTAVDKAESNQEEAFLINAEAVGNIARLCNVHNTTFIHFSTDYVFDGKGTTPYKEEDTANPVNYYGYTKWMGEQLALANNPQTLIIRTSWVYSSFGHNFVKTMLRVMSERTDINVVNDQFGSPTYARDLAETIITIANKKDITYKPGIYHFSNEGIISWYDFACAIKDIKKLLCNIHPIVTAQFPTPAQRPVYSVLNKTRIAKEFGIQLKDWRLSLEECLQLL